MTTFLVLVLIGAEVGYNPCPCSPDEFPPSAGVCSISAPTFGSPYQLQPGDLLLYRTPYRVGYLLSNVALCGGITHAGIVVPRADGSLALLETPYIGAHVTLLDIPSRLHSYGGTIWVRRRCCPLTADQLARLTAFACSQEGKPYDFCGLIMLPISYPLRITRSHCLTTEQLDPSRWFCSSLVVGACAAAGLLDPCVVKPTSTRPNDLRSDRILDLSQGWEKPVLLSSP